MAKFVIRLFVVAIALTTAACSGERFTDPTPAPAPAPNPGGQILWSTLASSTCTVNPSPVAPEDIWKSEQLIKENEGGITYREEWTINGPNGPRVVRVVENGMTQQSQVGLPVPSRATDYAPKPLGSYSLTYTRTESKGTIQNPEPLTTQCTVKVEKK